MTVREQRAARLVELLGPLCEAERVSRELAASGEPSDRKLAFKLASLRAFVDTEGALASGAIEREKQAFREECERERKRLRGEP